METKEKKDEEKTRTKKNIVFKIGDDPTTRVLAQRQDSKAPFPDHYTTVDDPELAGIREDHPI